MRHKDVVYLITEETIPDGIGNQITVETERQVFANEFAVDAKEFYSAATTGLNPTTRWEVYTFEYNGEEKLKHNDITYSVIRAETKGEKTRLSCTRKVGV